MKREVVPNKADESSKKQQVARMFNQISGTYDFLNHFLSLGIDITWRKKIRKILTPWHPKTILDLATGTADLAIELAALKPDRIIGSDIAEQMLAKGRDKLSNKKLDKLITLEYADSENLHYESDSFDAVTVAFGVRNYENLEKGLAEIHRVLKPGGIAAILEFSQPQAFPLKQLYHFYFKNVLPLFGRLFSKNQEAYSYLPESVDAFPSGEAFLQQLQNQGFKYTQWTPLTFGISSIYTGQK